MVNEDGFPQEPLPSQDIQFLDALEGHDDSEGVLDILYDAVLTVCRVDARFLAPKATA